MNTIFIGGSRHVSRLPTHVKERLKNIVSSGHRVIVGDAPGADKAVQKYLADVPYNKVTVFCSGETYRNNVGHWPTQNVKIPGKLKGFQFYAAKDRQMAHEADFGLMIWDGKSPGTVLNVLRLVREGKIAVLFDVPDKQFVTFKTGTDWDGFIAQKSPSFVEELRMRATPEEWVSQPDFLPTSNSPREEGIRLIKTDEQLVNEINEALGAGDTALVVEALGDIARTHGMSQIAKASGLARESLYRSLKSEGNPEFTTVLKVFQALGLHLRVTKAAEPDIRPSSHAT